MKISQRQRNESKMHNQDYGLLDCILAISSSLSFCFLCLLIIVQLLFCSCYKMTASLRNFAHSSFISQQEQLLSGQEPACPQHIRQLSTPAPHSRLDAMSSSASSCVLVSQSCIHTTAVAGATCPVIADTCVPDSTSHVTTLWSLQH